MSHERLLQSIPAAGAALCVVFCAALLFAPLKQVTAAGFSVLITPPRFELRARPGELLRQVVEISNVAGTPARLFVQTADWQFGEDGSVAFDTVLAADSCRPWSALESRELEVGPNGRRRYRFEIAVPPDALERECRFAILFEGEPEPMGALSLPVSGRLGVIVYVAVGEASPQLELQGLGVEQVEAGSLPALTVTNTGSAHTRLEGFLSGRDSAGRDIVFIPQSSPILPGQTRTILLNTQSPAGQPSPVFSFPLRLSGRLEWSGRRLDIDQVFAGE
jgi:fimbrial chaperone protein